MAAPSHKPRTKNPVPPEPAAPEHVPRNAAGFQRREWILQRTGWVLLALIALGGLSGVFGEGPLAHAAIEDEVARVEYDRFTRSKAETEWRVTLKGGATSTAEVTLGEALATEFKIVAIHPQPTTTRISGQSHTYVFNVSPERGAAVRFVVEPARMGMLEGSFRFNGAAPLQIWQFAYP